jgi:hypothetical protein
MAMRLRAEKGQTFFILNFKGMKNFSSPGDALPCVSTKENQSQFRKSVNYFSTNMKDAKI